MGYQQKIGDALFCCIRAKTPYKMSHVLVVAICGVLISGVIECLVLSIRRSYVHNSSIILNFFEQAAISREAGDGVAPFKTQIISVSF
jgi:hypothetical protein